MQFFDNSEQKTSDSRVMTILQQQLTIKDSQLAAKDEIIKQQAKDIHDLNVSCYQSVPFIPMISATFVRGIERQAVGTATDCAAATAGRRSHVCHATTHLYDEYAATGTID